METPPRLFQQGQLTSIGPTKHLKKHVEAQSNDKSNPFSSIWANFHPIAWLAKIIIFFRSVYGGVASAGYAMNPDFFT